MRDLRSLVILESAAGVQRHAEVHARLSYLDQLVHSLIVYDWPGSTARDPDSSEIASRIGQMTNLRALVIANGQINRRLCAAVGAQRLHTLRILPPWPILGAAMGLLLPLYAPAAATLTFDEFPTHLALPIGWQTSTFACTTIELTDLHIHGPFLAELLAPMQNLESLHVGTTRRSPDIHRMLADEFEHFGGRLKKLSLNLLLPYMPLVQEDDSDHHARSQSIHLHVLLRHCTSLEKLSLCSNSREDFGLRTLMALASTLKEMDGSGGPAVRELVDDMWNFRYSIGRSFLPMLKRTIVWPAAFNYIPAEFVHNVLP